MGDLGDDTSRRPMRPGQVARLLLPVFAVSTLVMLAGVMLVLVHHRSLGLFFVVVGAGGGFAVRTRLMLRGQQGHRPWR